jgi:peptide/nickel transport system permease protein
MIIGQWWPSVFPGIAMSLTVFGFAVMGEALQTVLLRRT